ncbi:nucleotidyltransferase family protein [Actinokineospora alba]|uniref:nucleotidyltransferase family protein n=1 Tax=Actinokineospora alba TaxID=504798 RepID=UPI001E305719|nr:nucleotidyltransferase family protein [Actinokineospora alba]
MTKVSAALHTAGIRFALTGGCAVYARGGPETEHDVDVLVKLSDVDDAVRALVAQGMRAAPPPEDWLTKVYDGDRLVDLLFRPNERPVTDEVLDRSEVMRVGPATMPVQSATDVMIGKLLALGTHRGDLNEPMQSARALREQIDWSRVAVETAESPYAEAFLLLAGRLGVSPRLIRIPDDRPRDTEDIEDTEDREELA